MIRLRRLNVADLDRAERFYTEVLGMAAMRLPDQRLISSSDGRCALFWKLDWRLGADPSRWERATTPSRWPGRISSGR